MSLRRNKKQYNIERMLLSRDPSKFGTYGIGGQLATLWRVILADLAISPNTFERWLGDYVENARRSAARSGNVVKRHFTRGNERRALEAGSISFRTFIKGMKLLKISKVKFAVELTHASGRVTVHQHAINLGDPNLNRDLYREKETDDDEDGHDGHPDDLTAMDVLQGSSEAHKNPPLIDDTRPKDDKTGDGYTSAY